MNKEIKPNLSYHYYKGYYKNFDKIPISQNKTENGWEFGLDKDRRKKYAKEIEEFFKDVNSPFLDFKIEEPLNSPANIQSFQLLTTYPGLLFGTGYTHGVGEVGEFKLGFYFDYTTGMPLIPGHAVKGSIRSAFPDFKNDSPEFNDIKNKKPCPQVLEINQVKARWIAAVLDEIKTENYDPSCYTEPKKELADGELEKIYQLQLEIFEGVKDHKKKEAKNRYHSIYQRDIFHEAIPIDSEHTHRLVFDTDSITPHIKKNLSYEESMLKNPTPLLMLKVLPKVRFQFNFDLKKGLLTVDQKLRLFQKILLTIGIGAKTNVGYGQFIEAADIPKPTHQTNVPKIDYTRSTEATRQMKKDSTWEGVIVSFHREHTVLKLKIGDETIYLKKKSEKIKGVQLEIGSKIQIKMLQDATETSEPFEAILNS